MNIYNQISGNKTKTFVIMALFIVFITFLAYIFGQVSGYGPGFTFFAIIISAFSSVGSYYFSDKIVLALSGAKEVKEEEMPKLFHLVENLAMGDGLPMPKVYLMEDSSINAFATGRNPDHAAVAVTRGAVEKLENEELEGVLAHELSHIKNFDTRLMMIVAVLVGTVTLLADGFMRSSLWGRRDDENRGGNYGAVLLFIGLILAALSPIIAVLIQLAISRKREYLADASGALLTRYPKGLALALEKIAADKRPLATANKATAHLYIANPFKNDFGARKLSGLTFLFNTHPPIEERIKLLREM